jgi:hypothetical protein
LSTLLLRKRIQRRTRVLKLAEVLTEQDAVVARVRDLSASGASLEMEPLLSIGSAIQVTCKDFSVLAQVVWA